MPAYPPDGPWYSRPSKRNPSTCPRSIDPPFGQAKASASSADATAHPPPPKPPRRYRSLLRPPRRPRKSPRILVAFCTISGTAAGSDMVRASSQFSVGGLPARDPSLPARRATTSLFRAREFHPGTSGKPLIFFCAINALRITPERPEGKIPGEQGISSPPARRRVAPSAASTRRKRRGRAGPASSASPSRSASPIPSAPADGAVSARHLHDFDLGLSRKLRNKPDQRRIAAA